MSKRKKRKPIKKTNTVHTKPNSKHKTIEKAIEPKGWNKPLTKRGKILFVTVSISIIAIASLITIYFIGNNRQKSQGYVDIKTMFNSYFTAVNDGDKFAIDKCLHIRAPSYQKDVNEHRTYVETLRKENVKIDIDSINIQENNYPDEISELEQTIHLKPITDAKLCYVSFDEIKTDTENNIKYKMNTYCRTICYNISDKWYLWDIINLDSTLIDITDIDDNDIDVIDLLYDDIVTEIGNKYTGKVYMPGEWVANEVIPSDTVKSAVDYTSQYARLTMTAYNSDRNAQDLANSICSTLIDSEECNETLVQTTTKLGKQDAIFISYTDTSTNTYSAMWIFRDASKDEYLHCIALDCTDANPALMKYYVSSFSL